MGVVAVEEESGRVFRDDNEDEEVDDTGVALAMAAGAICKALLLGLPKC